MKQDEKFVTDVQFTNRYLTT